VIVPERKMLRTERYGGFIATRRICLEKRRPGPRALGMGAGAAGCRIASGGWMRNPP
jgi:hypothetical protein